MANALDFLAVDSGRIGNGGTGYLRNLAIVGHISSAAESFDGAFRFTGINIPQGTTVSSASLWFYIDQRGSGSGNIKFLTYGIDEDNTADFASDPFARTKTTAFQTQNESLQSEGNYKQTVVTGIVNEILGRGGWSSGNAMGFLMEDNGSDSDVYMRDPEFGSSTLHSRLNILVTANSDFTPGPYSVGVGSPPDPRNFGIRISRRGFDAMSENIQGLSLFSKAMILKAVHDAERGWPTASNQESVSHGLKYAPTFLTFYKKGGKVYLTNSNDAASGLPTQRSYTDADKIVMSLDPNASDLDSWYYYVFIDENL